ncbi:DNA topoisomerase 1 type prokaryotic [Pyramimonas orientalis virus]|uniref:DNA topoisomerase n=1 Tax=Pyramimonas orientalis virus 01B TaxID=3134525 RepID=A0A7L9AXB4_9VIRU|nr:DNA topoisomerase 1 type prokaryotic [Pyramimonas orientalis virus]QOI90169.1 DNA topoisomerase 1 type prokaryotic [Pyramimonas orientalis virus]
MKVLVIVESSTKEKTIQKYLQLAFKGQNNTYTVKASGGHICDIVKKDFGLDKTTLQPIYAALSDKKKTIDKLKLLVKENDITLLASDNDREGEAIAWHLKNILKPKNYKRIIFNEITQTALYNAVTNPKDIDMNMVNSQQARRVLDRLVGFNLTKVLWGNFSSQSVLSAGRVQSVVLMLVANKEHDVRQFETEKYWNMLNSFDNGIVDAKLYKGSNIHKFVSKEETLKVLKLLVNNKYSLSNSNVKDILEYPDKPFTTSTLQQKATSHGFSIKETMKVAQELYELGHITYMRTDSTILSEDFQVKIKAYIQSTFGAEYENNGKKKQIKKQKNAQEAHEAIRPTKLVRLGNLNPKQTTLYNLIFNRTVASLMIPAKYKELQLHIQHESLVNQEMYFVGKVKHIIELGYKRVYCAQNECKDTKNVEQLYETFKKKTSLKSIEARGNCIWTTPPQRYNEATIIKSMEESGIGRPSTYVSILNKLYERRFVTKADVDGEEKTYDDYILKNGKITKKEEKKPIYYERSKIIPSDSGLSVNTFLLKQFGDIVNLSFTSNMETELDKISEGQNTYNNMIKKFYGFILEKCNIIPKRERGTKTSLEAENYSFDINGMNVIVRIARFGPVIEILPTNAEEKSRFITLKPYMKMSRVNDLKDITPKDISFLLQFPVKFKDYVIHYKSYGFYVENSKKDTLTIYAKFFQNLQNKDYSFVESIFDKEKVVKQKYKKKSG